MFSGLVPRMWKPSMSVPPGGGDLADRLHDADVCCAATEVAGDGLPDLVLGGVRVLGQKSLRRHDEPRRAVAALERTHLQEPLLERVQAVALGDAFDGFDGPTVRVNTEG